MFYRCDSLDRLLKEEELLIKRHIKKHQYYTHKNTGEAISDFIGKYGWIIREVYCNSSCSKSKDCNAYQTYLKNNKEIENGI